jgi:Phage integrase, N-terminal SAM-like domain
MAHIQKKTTSSGETRYEVRWTERVRDAEGNTVAVRHRQKSSRSHKAAKDFKPLHEADSLRGDLLEYDAAALPLRHYAGAWLRSMRGEVKERTLSHYDQALRTHVLPALGDWPVGSIGTSRSTC